MAGTRRGEAICDSLLFTLAVVVSIALALVFYRQNLQSLLRTVFIIFIVFCAFLLTRHALYRFMYRVRAFLRSRRPPVEEEEEPRPKVDRSREEVRRRVQERYTEKAKEYDRQIGAPRREKKLQELEEKMKFIRGFKGEGRTVGGTGGGASVLLSTGTGAHEHHMTSEPESRDSHMMEEDQSDGEVADSELGRVIQLALRLPDTAMVKKPFRTKHKVKAVYKWLEVLGYSPKDYCIATVLPKRLLLEENWTLEDYGIVGDSTLVVDERDTE